jgi:hypothetical protein
VSTRGGWKTSVFRHVPPAAAAVTPPRIYIARAVDGRTAAQVEHVLREARDAFAGSGFVLLDPVAWASGLTGRAIVERQLSILADCDAVIADLSARNHQYIGCVAELVYAAHWEKTVVVLGPDSLVGRIWLEYHCAGFVSSWAEARRFLESTLGH